MNYKARHYLSLLTAACVLLSGCTDLNLNDVDKLEYNPSIAVPLGTVEAKIGQLLESSFDENFVADSATGNCFIVWRQDNIDIEFDMVDFTTGATISKRFDITDYPPFNGSAIPSGSITIPKGNRVSITTDFDYNFDYNEFTEHKNIRVDSMLVGTSQLRCAYNLTDINISPTMPLKIIISFPDIDDLKNYTIERLVYSNTGYFEDDINLYQVEFKDNTTLTGLSINFEIVSDGGLQLTDNSSIQLTATFQLIKAQAAWGEFKKDGEISRDRITKELPMNLFESSNIINNQLLFTNPQITFDIVSNIGIPLTFTFDSIYATDKDNQRVWADFNGKTAYSMDIEMPDQLYGESKHRFLFDRNNGGTNRLFTITPKDVNYTWSVKTDGTFQKNHLSHFLIDPVKLYMDMEILLPLQLDPTSFFIYEDTLQTDLSSLLGVDTMPNNLSIELLKIYINSKNNMPLNATAEAIFLDENNDEIFRRSDITIPSPKVDNQGAAIAEVTDEQLIQFEESDIETILQTKQIIIRTIFKGYDDNAMIKIGLQDRVQIKLSIFSKINYTIELNK